MNEIVQEGNVYHVNGGYFQKGKTNCRLNQSPRSPDIDYSHGNRLLLTTITVIKYALDIILEKPEYFADILRNPSSIDYLLKTKDV